MYFTPITFVISVIFRVYHKTLTEKFVLRYYWQRIGTDFRFDISKHAHFVCHDHLFEWRNFLVLYDWFFYSIFGTVYEEMQAIRCKKISAYRLLRFLFFILFQSSVWDELKWLGLFFNIVHRSSQEGLVDMTSRNFIHATSLNFSLLEGPF